MVTPSECDVNRVQGVTSSQGRLYLCIDVQVSSKRTEGEHEGGQTWREMGGEAIRELKRYDIAHPAHPVQLVICYKSFYVVSQLYCLNSMQVK